LTRRSLLASIGALIAAPAAAQEPEGFAVTGPLTATDSELQAGYAQLGDVLMVAVNPKSTDLMPRLQAMVGRKVRIEVAPV
jgi:hypothetical protein